MNDFMHDAIEGLSASPKTLPCKYLYDTKGSDLFEQICQTEDYYVTRADLALHQTHLEEIAKQIGPNAHIIEFGSGAGVKTELLLSALDAPRAYTPIEISPSALDASVRELALRFPGLDIVPLQADYTEQIDPDDLKLNPAPTKRVVYFPGSTIGNFSREEATAFLQRMAKIAQFGGMVLVGVDLIKPTTTLLRAYDDADGITAQFNKNILVRLKKEADADIDPNAFVHEARYNETYRRVEMHLVATRKTTIRVNDRSFDFEPGQSIHTESSHKYSIEDFQQLATLSGLQPVQYWLDPDKRFSMHCLIPQANV